MDILLTQSYLIERDPPEKKIMRPFPPLGIMYLASYLKEHGFDAEVLDNTFESDLSNFEEIISRYKPKLVGISSVEISRKTALEMCSIAKKHKCLVVAGGCDPVNAVDSFLNAGADWVAVGEGEITITELAGFVLNNSPDKIEMIPGLYYRSGSETVFTTERGLVSEIDSLPPPYFDDSIISKYFEAWMNRHSEKSLALVSSRGCPHNCAWCSRNVFGRTLRRVNPAGFVNQIEHLQQRFNPDYFWFADDSFTSSSEWLVNFNSELDLRNLKIKYECLGRVDEITPQKARILAQSGCRLIWFGAESGSELILSAMKKGFKVEAIQRAREIMKDAGVPTGFFIMLGYPPENVDDVLKTVKLIKETAPDKVGVSVAYPIAGTDFHNEIMGNIIGLQWDRSGENRPIFKTRYAPLFYRFASRLILKTAQIASLNSMPSSLDKMKLSFYNFGMKVLSIFSRVK